MNKKVYKNDVSFYVMGGRQGIPCATWISDFRDLKMTFKK
jgi:hypothetical protein